MVQLNMSTTKARIMKVARDILEAQKVMDTAALAAAVSNRTRDGVSAQQLGGLLGRARDIEKVPETKDPVHWRIKGNLDADENGGGN
mgnify:FL=1